MALNKVYRGAAHRTLLSIKNGKLVHISSNMKRTYFSSLTGNLESITMGNVVVMGDVVSRWCVNLRDGNERYTIHFRFSSGVFVQMILALSNCENLNSNTVISIKPYQNGRYTKVMTIANGKQIKRVLNDIPCTTSRTGGIVDEAKRMENMLSMVDDINNKLDNGSISSGLIY